MSVQSIVLETESVAKFETNSTTPISDQPIPNRVKMIDIGQVTTTLNQLENWPDKIHFDEIYNRAPEVIYLGNRGGIPVFQSIPSDQDLVLEYSDRDMDFDCISTEGELREDYHRKRCIRLMECSDIPIVNSDDLRLSQDEKKIKIDIEKVDSEDDSFDPIESMNLSIMLDHGLYKVIPPPDSDCSFADIVGLCLHEDFDFDTSI